MIHNQSIQTIQAAQTIHNEKLQNNSNLEATKTIQVSVINQLGQSVNSYEITGNLNEKVGNKLEAQNPNEVIQVLVNGEVSSMNQLQNMNISNINSVTIMTQNGIGVNSQYMLNGMTYSLPANSNNIVDNNFAKIYVPSNLLNTCKVTSVTIDGINYDAKIVGNYVEVNAPIAPVSSDNHNVIVNLNNGGKANYGKTTTTNAQVQVIVMNQNGVELSSETLNKANGTTLAMEVAKANNQITSLTYNGNQINLMQLLTQEYTPGTSNIFVINEFTQAPINMNVNIYGNNTYIPATSSDTITSAGASLNLPAGLLRHYKISSVTINGVEYKGTLEGDKYVINEFIPTNVEYQVSVNAIR
ncbi:MAG: hypothetical protein ACRC57_07360 [Sarcina sp.]